LKTYLVTGAAGFIGHKTCEFLVNEGHKVVGIDNLNDYYDVRLKEFRKDLLSKLDNFEFHKIDIENYSELEELFKKFKFDAVINLAARAGVRYSLINPHIYMTTNGHGSLNLLELMRYHDVKKYVLASTSSLYAGQEMPFLETLPVNEPISPYAATKKAAEAMAYTYHHLFDIDVTIVRYFTVYGPYSRPDMAMLRFIRWIDEGKPIQLFGDGTQSRDFTHVDDIARGTIAALKNVGHEVVNLGGGNNPISINTMIEMIEKELGKKAIVENLPFHKADMKVTWANIDKAKNLLNWEPQITFQDGVKDSLDVYKKESILKEIVLP
jgi:UDP-glucuronate 4-epimerase